MLAHGFFEAPLGQTSRLLVTPQDRRWHVLDALGAELLQLQHQGYSMEALANLVANEFGLPPEAAAARAQSYWQLWRDAGLLHTPAQAGGATPAASQASQAWQLDQPNDPTWPAPQPRPRPLLAQHVQVADRHIALHCPDPALQARLHVALGPPANTTSSTVDHVLALCGTANAWQLTLEGATLTEGSTPDQALVATLGTLVELGCRPAERLLVVHGAGVVGADGTGTLLVARGGSGKTTLAAALDAAGYPLLSDDVVPTTLAGQLLGLGLPLCLKPGSWPVLAPARPDIARHPPLQRLGQTVRYLPPRHPAAGAAVPAARILLTRYAPGQAASCESVSPEAALQALVEAECVWRNITQAKVTALANWLNHVPAYRLHYPSLAAGLQQVQALAGGPPPAPLPQA